MKKNQAETFLIMGIIGLHITLAIHVFVQLTTGIPFWASMASFSGMYPTWIVFFIIGLVKIRKRQAKLDLQINEANDLA